MSPDRAGRVGKSWLACALGYKACRENLSVLYQRVPQLFAALALTRGRRPEPGKAPHRDDGENGTSHDTEKDETHA